MAAETIDYTSGGTSALGVGGLSLKVVRKKLDLQTVADESGGALEASDVIQVLDIPANTFVIAAGVVPTVADGAVLTGDLGDGADPDGWVDGVDLNTTTALMTLAADGFGVDTVLGKFYATADTLDLTVATIGAQTSHSGVCTVWAIMVPVLTD